MFTGGFIHFFRVYAIHIMTVIFYFVGRSGLSVCGRAMGRETGLEWWCGFVDVNAEK